MPRTRSSRKPGCFSQVKPTLVFTDSPPEKLPRRLWSPLSAADNPVTAKVVCVEDGLEASWVSPQFRGNALEPEEPSKKRRRKPRGSVLDGKSSMASQPTTRTRARKPVALRRESTAATPASGKRGVPKGYNALQFVADDRCRKISSFPHEVATEGIGKRPIHDDDEDIRMSEVDSPKSEMRRPVGKSRQKGTNRETHLEKGRIGDGIDYSGDTDNRRKRPSEDPSIGRIPINGQRPRRSMDSPMAFSFDDEPPSSAHSVHPKGRASPQSRFTSLKDGHHSVREDAQLPRLGHSLGCIEPDGDDGDDGDDNVDIVKENLETKFDEHNDASSTFQESPKFDRSKRKSFHFGGPTGPPGSRWSSGDKMPSEDGNYLEKHNEMAHPLLSRVKQHRHSGLPGNERSESKVLVVDTPEPEYGLRVSLRQRKGLLPNKAMERLLLDS